MLHNLWMKQNEVVVIVNNEVMVLCPLSILSSSVYNKARVQFIGPLYFFVVFLKSCLELSYNDKIKQRANTEGFNLRDPESNLIT